MEKDSFFNRLSKLSRKNIYLCLLMAGFVFLSLMGSFRFFVPYSHSYIASVPVYYENKDEERHDNFAEGVSVYGPGINLRKGAYKAAVTYKTHEDITYELIRDSGEIIKKGVLSKDKVSEEFDFETDRSVKNYSFEFKAYCNGESKPEFETFSYKAANLEVIFFVPAVVFLVLYSLILLFVKENKLLWGLIALGTEALLMSAFLENPMLSPVSALIIFAFAMVTNIDYMGSRLKSVTLEEVAVSLLSAFLATSTIMYVANHGWCFDINYVSDIAPDTYLITLWFSWAVILAVRILLDKKHFVYQTMLLSSVIFGYVSVKSCVNIYFALGVLIILGYFNYYLLKDDKLGFEALVDRVKNYKVVYLTVGLGMLFSILLYSFITICRYSSFHAACFDFGIFAQMYEYMAKTGIPLTTCERGYLVSHFYIHFSPIYYLFLPVYMLFRTPEALLVIQAVMVFGAVIPLLLLLKEKGVKPVLAIIICYIYILSPAVTMPLLFDFHENKFIPFFMLWFIYFYETKRYKLMYPTLLLTLMIKEDTAVYMIAWAIYFIISGKNRKHGVITLLCSVVYFLTVMAFIQTYGMGLMESRYDIYYLEGQRGVLSMAKNIIYAPGFFVKNIFSFDNFEYIIYMLGALTFVPIINKDLKRLVLLLPFVAFNLMTDYKFQHDIGYQYNYGSVVAMLYLFILNTEDFPRLFKNLVCLTSLIGVIILGVNYDPNTYAAYPGEYLKNATRFDSMNYNLENMIEKDAGVTAGMHILAHLAYHDELYLFNDGTLRLTDYYVLEASKEDDFKIFSESEIFDKYYRYYADDGIVIYKLK